MIEVVVQQDIIEESSVPLTKTSSPHDTVNDCGSDRSQRANTKLLIAATVRAEAMPTIRRLRLSAVEKALFKGSYASQNVLVTITGVGRQRACQGIEQILDKHRPQRLILIGFAGGLNTSMKAGDLVDVSGVMNTQGNRVELSCDDRWLPHYGDHSGLSKQGPTRWVSDLITLDRLVSSPHEKHALHKRYGAGVVDMESYHVARLATKWGVPIRILRAVSDPVDTTLPIESLTWTRPDGRTNLAAVGAYLARRPWQLGIMISLARHASRAAEALAAAVANEIQAIADGVHTSGKAASSLD